MAERLPSTANGSHDNTLLLPQNQTQSNPSPQNATHHPLPETSESAFRSGTYIVQVPKDQIYRVPPPEHAVLAERHRNPPRRKKSCCTCFFCIFAVVIAIALILGLVGGITSIFVRKNSPTFRVEHVLIKNPTLDDHSEFDITLKSKNPNDHARISYDQGGDAKLSFRQQEIAVGTYPTFDQEPKNSTVFRLILHGSNNVVLPQQIKKSMQSRNPRVHVSLSLLMNATVRLKIGGLQTRSSKIAVTCNLTVDTLAKDTRILFQECQTKG